MEKYPHLLTDKLLEKDIKHPLEGYLFLLPTRFMREKPTL